MVKKMVDGLYDAEKQEELVYQIARYMGYAILHEEAVKLFKDLESNKPVNPSNSLLDMVDSFRIIQFTSMELYDKLDRWKSNHLPRY